MRPGRLFDTELAGRLLGYPKVGLGSIVEEVLGLRLEKGHSAADWSTRPLPEPWLRYAALDVEVLVELRDRLADQLDAQGKREWAEEEFAAIVTATTPTPRVDPWRRTSGMHRIRNRRQLAVVRALWEARDRTAQRRDVSPGRVLPDSAIVDAAVTQPASEEALRALKVWGGKSLRRQSATWYAVLRDALALTEDQLPPLKAAHDGPPPARSWTERDPDAAERLSAARSAVAAIADEHGLPTENLLAPDAIRRLAWRPPDPLDVETVGAVLRAHGAREWQVRQTAMVLARALDRVAVRSVG
jgi:ribonuclease D